MATYEKTTFVDGAAPAITANELNKIGNGILEALSNTENLTTSVSNLSTRVSNIESSIGTSGNIGTKVANSLSTITWNDSTKKLTKTTNSGTSSDVFTASELKADLGITIADTTGTVDVNRGGTGRETLTSNAVLYGNGTNDVGMKQSANGALYATAANGALSWGTLPIAQGGTGKTSASEAWTALGGGAIGKKASLAASDIPDISTAKLTSGTLGVARGGTGATSFTSGALLVGNGTSAIGTRSITNNTSIQAITTGTEIPTKNTIAYWDGSYSTNGASNLKYLGTVTKGTWQGSTIDISYGGTGATTWSGIRSNLYIGYGTSLPTTNVVGHIYFKY